MATAAELLQVAINKLQAARDSGVLSVGHGTDKVVYQSPQSMDVRLAAMKAELVTLQGGTPRSRVGYIEQSSKGFGNWDDPCNNVSGFNDE